MSKINKVAVLFGATALIVSSLASAITITHNGYSHDTSTNVVVGGGLEWLRWDETIGASIGSFQVGELDGTIGSGWSLATGAQIAILYDTYYNEDVSGAPGIAYDSLLIKQNEDAYRFLQMWGVTDYLYDGYCSQFCGASPRARAFYSPGGLDDSAALPTAFVQLNTMTKSRGNYLLSDLDGSFYRAEVGTAAPGGYGGSYERYAAHDYGLALVRSAPSAVVPAPPVAALLLAGLLGLGFAARRKIFKP
jgi:hypothetical protein